MGTILLIRHGQASFGAAEYDQLSETGVRQAELLGQSLASRVSSVDEVWCGTMKRHRQTAGACLAAMGVSLEPQADAGWDEYDHEALITAFEPRYRDRAVRDAEFASSEDPMRAFQRMFADAAARWVGGAHDADYPETWSAFRGRVSEALGKLARSVGKSRTALVFTSGGPISAVCGSLLHVPEERRIQLGWTLANTGVTKLLCRGEVVHLSTLNEHSHLEGEHRRLITYR